MKKWLFIIAGIFLAAALTIGGVLLGKYIQDEKAQESYRTVTEENYASLNADGVAFLRIDGLNIAYPVAQRDNEYYLTHDYFGAQSEFGCLFLDQRNDLGNAQIQNFVIYGHSMQTGAMFERLKEYLYHYDDPAFLAENGVITLTVGNRVTKWKLFAAYYANATDDYIQTQFESGLEYERFLQGITARSLYKTDYDLSKSLLTLSSCNYNAQGDRRVVQFQQVAE